ncbi:hypothetical protein KR222_009381, partial [Zaprionus bogoriensis]
MNLGALARSLSNSLRFGVANKKQLEAATSELEAPATPAQSERKQTPAAATAAAQAVPPSSSSSSSSNNRTLAKLSAHRPAYKQTVEEILQKVSELEHTLYEDQRQEFKLRMALEQQTERVNELDFSLDTEKLRNQRLVQLLRGIDSDSPSDSDNEPETEMLSGLRLQSSGEIYGSISPLLMQQRYDELSASHRQTHRQLAKKEKALKLLKCDLEELRGQHDSLLGDYRSEQSRLEALCARYVHLQQKKKSQICLLKETLGFASECILHAQMAIASGADAGAIDQQQLTTFNQKLEFFMRALRNCCCLRKLQQLEQQQ